jgi:FlaA1/EpsC-like NDP-sugar epimerase
MKNKSFLQGKKVLVIGACGTVGGALIRLLHEGEYQPAEVMGIDNNESGLFFLDQSYVREQRTRFLLADVRDRDKLCRAMSGIDVVFHTAAFKHVIMCERSPFEAVQTNINGVQNVIYAAFENEVEKVIFTSSDKAVNPTNVMGTSKLMGERLMTAANCNHRGLGPIFTSTRFGNVLGSSGSVVPIFHRQIAHGGPVTLTDPRMTRFVMSVRQAVKLVVDSVALARGGEVLITKMPVIRISDLAEVMIEELAPQYGYDPGEIQIVEIGAKPGEKLYEELMTQEEVQRAVELTDYFAVTPAFRDSYRNIVYDYEGIFPGKVSNPYISSNEQPLTKADLLSFLTGNNLLAPTAAQ